MKMTISTMLLATSLLAFNAKAADVPAPVADHHQHLFSPAAAKMFGKPDAAPLVLGAAELIELLDKAGIERATVMSVAYMYGSPNRVVEDEYAKVKAENDWNGAQAALYPKRLRAFCGVNPLKDYALAEIARCAASANLKHGLKLHLGNSRVQLENPEHLERMRQVFALANKHRMAIGVHMRASISLKLPYGAEQGRLFLEQLLPQAPDIPVQIAHMGGTGPGFDDPPAHAAIGVLTQAASKGDPRTRNLWFEVASIAHPSNTAETSALIARLVRQAGIDRVLYGSDAAVYDNLRPREAWAAFKALPLTEAELTRIARNVAPYWR
jgi:predicted TIM-barrel fold metal-dependent hydrolase